MISRFATDWMKGAIHESEAHGIVDASEFMMSPHFTLGCVAAVDFAVPRSWVAPFVLSMRLRA